MSKKVFTVMLRKHDEATGLTLYQARAKSYNEAVLLMRVQGIVPVYDIMSYTERPAREFLLGVLFPKRVATSNKEIQQVGGKARFWSPLGCWIRRQHLLVTWQGHGQFCRRCKGVFPL